MVQWAWKSEVSGADNDFEKGWLEKGGDEKRDCGADIESGEMIDKC